MKAFRITDSEERVTDAGAENGTRLVPAGTLLFVVRGMSLAKEFRVGVASRAVTFNQDLRALVPSSDIDPVYLTHFLRGSQRAVLSMVDHASHGTTRLTSERVEALPVPIPPLDEQRRIAQVLDRAEALRAKRRAALRQVESLTQAIFLDLFGDPVKNAMGWPQVKFGEVGTLDRGVSKHRPRNAPELLGGPYPLVQTGEVANCDGYIREHTASYSDVGLRQSKLWRAGTLCITIAANIAKTGILTFDACFPDSVVGFQSEERATVEYIRVWLSFLQRALEASAPESAQKNINLAILRALDVPVPPLRLQRVFADRIAAVEKLKSVQRRSLSDLDALFASLQHHAFRGEI